MTNQTPQDERCKTDKKVLVYVILAFLAGMLAAINIVTFIITLNTNHKVEQLEKEIERHIDKSSSSIIRYLENM